MGDADGLGETLADGLGLVSFPELGTTSLFAELPNMINATTTMTATTAITLTIAILLFLLRALIVEGLTLRLGLMPQVSKLFYLNFSSNPTKPANTR
ncbi:MAG: hypothetical protein NWF04_10080 [Candidatus Bathyarchaeota archaeon]|nr:hypothetical protein [Candidatus Bathyarchaeota archaeon]